MRITLFGATGNIGGRVLTEAVSRGHEITAVLRDPARLSEPPAGVTLRQGDASQAEDVADVSQGQNLVISATRPAPGREEELAAMTRALLEGTARSGVRLLLVGGAASLLVPGGDGRMAVEDPAYVPEAWQAIARACVAQLDLCQASTSADWTYLSPPALLTPGERTGGYRLGHDELLLDAKGRSAISMEDFAVALLDEAEEPQHRRMRFTVAW